MKRILIITALLFITILNYAQVPFKIYGDLQEFQNYKWFIKPKPQDSGNRDSLITVSGNAFKVRIIDWDTVGKQEPDSLYIQYDSLCLVDSSGWTIIGDTLFVDTCSTSPFKGCDTSSYDPNTNILTICDSVYNLTWVELWAKVTSSTGVTYLHPRNTSDWNVGMGMASLNARLSVQPKNTYTYGINAQGSATAAMINVANSIGAGVSSITYGNREAIYGRGYTATGGIFESSGSYGLNVGNDANYPTIRSVNKRGKNGLQIEQNNTTGPLVLKPVIEMNRYGYGAITDKSAFIMMRDTNVIEGTLDSYWIKGQYVHSRITDTTDKWYVTYAGQEYLADTLFTDKAVMATQTLNAGDPAGVTTQVYGGGIFMGDLNTYPDFVGNVKTVGDSDTSWSAQLTTGASTMAVRQDTSGNTWSTIESDSVNIYNNIRLGLSDGVETPDSNYAQFDKDGHMTLHGKATVWDDLFFPFGTGETAGTGYPAFVADSGYYTFVVDTTGASKCIKYFTIQMPHSWKLSGSKIYPHVHYKHESGVGSPKFIMKYKWYNTGVSTDFGWKWYRMETVTGTDNKAIHMVYGSGGITPPNDPMKISSIIICQVYLRDNPTNVKAYQFDIHIEMDTMGSNEETNK